MRRLAPILALLVLLAIPALASGFGSVFRPVQGNPADKLGHLEIDDYRYDRATGCRKGSRPGTAALSAWLARNAGGASWGIYRCEKWGKNSASLHAEGRALDWALNARNSTDRREAERIISLLLAPDKFGNEHALARRMGIQEIIFNCKSWWSGQEAMEKYSRCYDDKGRRVRVDDTSAHRDHIHFGLSWPGAKMRTSFWAR